MAEADHRPLYSGRSKAFKYVLPVLVYSALLVPGFVLKGLGLAPLFYMRLLALCSLFFVVSRYVFEPFSRNEVELRHHRTILLAASFLPFCLYVFIQWFCGPLVFTASWPGSIARFTTLDDLIQLLTVCALFIVFYDFFKTRKRLQIAILLLALAIVGLIATGFYNEFSEVKRSSSLYGIDMSPVGVFYSFFINANHYGGFLAMATPLFAATIAHSLMKWNSGPRRFDLSLAFIEKMFYAILLPLMAVSMVVAKARAALVWQIVIIALIIVALGLGKKKAALAALTLALTGALVVFSSRKEFLPATLLTDLSFRWHTAKQAMEIVHDFPSFGTGYGTFHYIMSYYQTLNVENHYVSQPYNHFILLLSETGPLGVLLFFGPLIYYVNKCVQALSKNNSDWHRAFGWASAVAVMSVALPSLVDNYLTTPAITTLFVFYLALLGRCANGSFTEAQEARDRRKIGWVTGPKRWAIFAPLAILFTLSLGYITGDFLTNLAIESPSKSAEKLETAVSRRPDHIYGCVELGHFYYERALQKMKNKEKADPEITKSIEAYRRVTILAPTWPLGWNRLGQAELLAGKRDDGFGHLGFAVQLQLYNRDTHLYLIMQFLNYSHSSPWEDERKRYRKLALAWIDRSSKYLPRPFTPTDFVYLKNNMTPMSPEGQIYMKETLEAYQNEPKVEYKVNKSIKKIVPPVATPS